MTAKQAGAPDAEIEAEIEVGARRRWLRSRVILTAVLLLLLTALLVLWLERRPIAADYIDKALRARGVPARYRIETLGFRRQRLTDVVIGDPARPDLTAEWIELRSGLSLSGVRVVAVRAGHVLVKGRIVDGRLSLGAIDKLLPASSGAPFALPAIDADIGELEMRLVAPQGVLALKVRGHGRLNDGFSGHAVAASGGLDLGGCTTGLVKGAFAIKIAGGRPVLEGPLRASAITCGGAALSGGVADLSVTLGERLNAWTGHANLNLQRLNHKLGQVAAVKGTIDFSGSKAGTAGAVDIRSGRFATPDLRGGMLAVAGRYRIAGGGDLAFSGRAGARGAALAPSALARIARMSDAGGGTPIGPLAQRLAASLMAAGQGFDIDADVAVAFHAGRADATLPRLALVSRSGARASFGGGVGARYGWPAPGLRIGGTIVAGNGGLPGIRARVARSDPGAPVTGSAVMQPYAAGGSRLALAPVFFSTTPGGTTRIATRALLSGPLGAGRVDDLEMALSGIWDGRSRIVVNPECTPLSFRRVMVSGLVLRPARMRLCPLDSALIDWDGARLGGGARVAAPRLAGMLGKTPIGLSADSAAFRLASPRLDVRGLDARIGVLDRQTHLAFGRVSGAFANSANTGRFAGGSGRIANVPLLVSAAAGDWTLRGGRLAADGAMTVADTAADPRFKPLEAQGVSVTVADGRIAATATLVNPAKGVAVTHASIAHDLARGTGHADLAIPGIAFGKHLQPDDLTRLTYGVIADVTGTLSGEGHIHWTPEGVTSDGVFRTAGTDLAAVFGPVTGIAGEIRFTDLLNLESAAGQVATIKTLNPGIPVNDGTIRYRTLSGARVQVEQGRWPFAGGVLALEPTLLDFGQAQERRMTFGMTGVDAARFLQQFGFKNLDASGVFDGRLPMVFDASGGRIENGHLNARRGGGTIAYVGEISQKDVGLWGNFAFQALKSLRYRDLGMVMNGPLAGEMVTEVRFAGVGQGEGARRNFILDRLQRLPLVFNVRIKAPFRQLIDSAQSFYDPRRLIERNLPALIDEQNKRAQSPKPAPLKPAPPAIQPPESRILP